MNLIRLAIERPIAVIAIVLMVVMFGMVALRTIPIQLSPDVNRPVITVTTAWPGAAPAEVEREILNRQEEEMAGLEGLQSITGRAQPGRSRLTLEFNVGAMDLELPYKRDTVTLEGAEYTRFKFTAIVTPLRAG